jgi:hypothetical protein
MKKYLFLCLIALFTTSAMAQDTMLTKEETVNYLQKKLREVDGRYKTVTGVKFFYREPSIMLLTDGTVELVYTATSSEFCLSGYSVKYSYRFDPGEIVKVGIYSSAKTDDPVRHLYFEFKAKTVRAREDHWKGPRCQSGLGFKYGTNGQWGDLTEVEFPFFATSPENRGRITRAILHLRDLAKAEEDPFSK